VSDTSTETVSLNLDGTFSAEAAKAAAAADHLATSLDKTNKAGGPDVAKLKAGTDELKKQAAAAEETKGVAAKAGAAFAGWAANIHPAALAMQAVSFAAHAVIDSLKEAHAEVVAIENELGLAAGKMALLQSSKKEVQGAAFKKLGGDYEQTAKVALKLGMNEDEALAEAKKLLNAGFSKTEIPVLLRIKSGMDLAGQDGGALFKALEKIKLEPKVKTKDLDGLWKLGIDSKKVYADLDKQLGGVGKAAAALKAGTLDSGMVAAAVEKAAAEKYGSLADILGNSIPALLARIKGDFEHLFDGLKVDAVKSTLKSVITELEGIQGKELAAGLREVGDAITYALGGASGAKGAATVHDTFVKLNAAVKDLAKELHKLKPDIDAILMAFKAMSGAFGKDAAKAAAAAAHDQLAEARAKLEVAEAKARIGAGKGDASDYARIAADSVMTDAMRRKRGEILLERDKEDMAKNKTKATAASNAKPGGVPTGLNTGALPDNDNGKAAAADSSDAAGAVMKNGASDAGSALPDGMAEGINANASSAITAAEKMAEDALQAAKDKLGVHSPSTEFGEVGDNNAQGMANAMESHPGPAAAGKKMAAGALGAAQGAGGAGAPGGAAGGKGGGDIKIEIHVTGGKGAADDWAAMQPEIEAAVRRIDRDRHEAAA